MARGVAYEELGIKDSAITDYQNALKFNPSLTAAQDGLKRLGASVPAPAGK
jgi:lipoprotein NlpI